MTIHEKTIHEKLRAARLKKGLTMLEASKSLGYKSYGCIQKWENGQRVPSFSSLVKLAKLYNLDLNYLLGLKEEP
jgi:transcriptional regulator with XRE-family HTH domain